MAILRSYSATFEQTGLTSAAVARYRFNEGAGTDALDRVDGLDGSYESGAAPGAAGSIGDGAASFNGSTGFVLVDTIGGPLTISAFGDSLINGDGFQDPPDRFVPGLQAELDARGIDATVINNSINGRRIGELGDARTTDGIDVVGDVIAGNPDIVIVELGTNDALNSRPLGTVETNLTSIVSQLDGAGIEVLLTGAFGFYPARLAGAGQGYADAADRSALEALYPTIAGNLGVELLEGIDGSGMFLGGERIPGTPDTIEGGVLDSDDASLNVGDGLHPNAAGVDFSVEHVLPQTLRLIEPLLLADGAFEMVFTLDSLNQQQTLFAKDSVGRGTGGQIAAIVNTNGGLTFAMSDETDVFFAQSVDGAVEAGTPTHLVANFGSGGMQLFINGVLIDSNAYAGGLDAGLGNFEQLVIGAGNGSSTSGTIDSVDQFLNGTIDEFAVYDRPLTGDEIQQLFDGGAFGTTVVGTAAADTIIGGSDAEVLRGGGGNDTVRGGQGDDQLFGGRGADELRGGAGNDTLGGKDGNDVLAGGEGDDLLQGGAGNDLLSGAGGNDELFGNKGVDDLRGGAGDDLLNGGNGRDLLTGGPGSDIFQIDKISHGVDKIFDFEDGVGGDVLDLGAVLSFGDGDDVNDFVRLSEVGANTKVEVNANGSDGDFRAVFNLIGVNGLDIGNLVSDGNLDPGAPTS